jgi:glycogen(starch) synthase
VARPRCSRRRRARVCVDLTDVLGRGAPETACDPWPTRPGHGLVPIDREIIELVGARAATRRRRPTAPTTPRSPRDHHPWAVDGATPTTPDRRPRACRELARRHFVGRVAERIAGGGLCVCALDTELLGHWWYEGPWWLGDVVAECRTQGVELVPLDEAVAGAPQPNRWPPNASGPPRGGHTARTLSTWDQPGVPSWAGARARPSSRSSPRARTRRRARWAQLLALQSSDWAFLLTRELAGEYPRDRFEAHRTAMFAAMREDAPPVAPQPRAARDRARPGPAVTRVLILSWEYPPIVEGRAGAARLQALEQLAAQGTEVHVLTAGGARDPTELRAASTSTASRAAQAEDMDEFLTWIDHMNADMVRVAEELDGAFDLVHGHDWLVAMAADRLRTRSAARCVMTVHATSTAATRGWVDKHPQTYIHAAERGSPAAPTGSSPARTTCAATSPTSSACARRTCGHPQRDRPRRPRPGRGPHDAAREVRRPGRAARAPERRLVYEKGFQHALEALAGPRRRDRRGPRAALRHRGLRAPTRPSCKKLARTLGLDAHGTFLGWIGDDALHSLYRICDLCVIPSLYEPFGLVALEAMASGCPCIVADTGGLREVVPYDVGLRFKGGDAKHLGVMIERMLTDTALRDRLVGEASEHVLRFDWAAIARETSALYDALPRPRRAARSERSGRRDPLARPGPVARDPVVGLASAQRSSDRAAAPDALRQAVAQPLELGDPLVDARAPTRRRGRPSPCARGRGCGEARRARRRSRQRSGRCAGRRR